MAQVPVQALRALTRADSCLPGGLGWGRAELRGYPQLAVGVGVMAGLGGKQTVLKVGLLRAAESELELSLLRGGLGGVVRYQYRIAQGGQTNFKVSQLRAGNVRSNPKRLGFAQGGGKYRRR